MEVNVGMSEFIFHEAGEKHIEDLLNIYNYYVLYTTATFHAKPLTEEAMRSLIFFHNPKYKTFVMIKDDVLIGYVLLTQHKSREAYDRTGEVTVYLKPDYIGAGVGSLAVKYIEEFAKQKDFHVLVATICGENQKSIKVFERNGYEKCAHYKQVGSKFNQWLDVVAYQKIL
ncbi:MAG: Phosphinothricin N-acetyltransferase [Clostridiales bacterium]|jgi:phosphinothricin acetyltransferase|nr:Phosphinothricin N-acetyltransferase [Clostridiales bacterium]